MFPVSLEVSDHVAGEQSSPVRIPPTWKDQLARPGEIRSNIRRARSGTFPVSMSSAISSPAAGLMQTPSHAKRDAM
jgi:hypothetical protein